MVVPLRVGPGPGQSLHGMALVSAYISTLSTSPRNLWSSLCPDGIVDKMSTSCSLKAFMLVAVGRGANVGRRCSLALISMKSTGGGTIVSVAPFWALNRRCCSVVGRCCRCDRDSRWALICGALSLGHVLILACIGKVV